MNDKNTHFTGLTDRQILESRRLHGENILTPPPRPSLLRKFIGCFADPLIRILLVALLLSIGISVYEFLEESKGLRFSLSRQAYFFAIILATVIGFWLEVSADRKFDVLNKVNDDMLVKVIRNGGVTQVPRREIVVGDCCHTRDG